MSLKSKLTNSTLLLVAIGSAFFAVPFGKSFSLYESENTFMFFRLISFVLFLFVTIRVIESKSKSKSTTKK